MISKNSQAILSIAFASRLSTKKLSSAMAAGDFALDFFHKT